MISNDDNNLLVSVIIPTHNRSDLLSPSIESILKQKADGFNYEIIVVDNNSTDQTASLVADKIRSNGQTLRYVFEPQLGLVHGRHRGAREARGDILVFCDDDILACSGWLQSVYEAFCDPQVALVGGKILPEFMNTPPSWVDTFWVHDKVGSWMLYLSLIDLGEDFKDIPANYIFGANFSILKTILLECKGFHPDAFPRNLIYLRGDGEYGLSLEIMKRGYRSIYHPRAIVKHTIPEDRTTPGYFCWRSFCQGISDSYTQIRRHQLADTSANRPDISAQMDVKFITAMIEGGLRFEAKSISDVRTWVDFSYNQGWLYHRDRIKSDSKLLAYILKSTYFSFGESMTEREAMKSSMPAHQQQGMNYIDYNNHVDYILQNKAIQLMDDGSRLLGQCLFSDALLKFDEATYLFPKINGLQYLRAQCLQSIGRLREAELALQAELRWQINFQPAQKMLRDQRQAEGLEKILAIPTKLTFNERMLLLNSAKQVTKGGVIVEIGSYIGASSCFLAQGAAERLAHIYCVDTWQNDAMPEAKRDTFDEFHKNIIHYKECITPLKGESVEIASNFFKKIDLLFIDADHSYEGCKEDIEAWLPKMKHNGTIVFHDYGWAEGIQRAVQEFIQPIESMQGRQVDSIYWTKVNKNLDSCCESKDIINKFSHLGHNKTKSIADKKNQKPLDFEEMAISLYNGVNNDLSWVDEITLQLKSAVIYITDLCNSRCITCTSWKNKKKMQELGTDSWKNILEGIRATGISSVEFVGGEPLIRKDLPELATCAKELGFSTVLLSTNGLLLDEDRFAKLADSGINSYHISLDGMQDTYKFIRGVDWFDKVLSVCQMISDAGKPLMLLTNLVKHNIGELEYIAALAHKFKAQWFVNILENKKFHFKGIDIDSIQISSIKDIERTIRILEHIRTLYPRTSMLKAEDIKYIKDFLMEPENEKDIPCTLGFNEVYFDALGNFYPACMSLPAVGNAATEPSTQILHSSKYRSELKAMLLRRCTGCTCGYSQRAHLRATAAARPESLKRPDSTESIRLKSVDGMQKEASRLALSASLDSTDQKKECFPQKAEKKLSLDDISIDPSSNGHLDSKVFWFEGQVYRGLKAERANLYKDLFAKKIVSKLVDCGLIETEISPLKIEGFDLVLKHRKLPFRSFSFEWPIKMLKEAALTVINLNRALAKFGLQTMDAHNQNIMFDGTDSKFIDFASISPFAADEGIRGGWYQQFCEFFFTSSITGAVFKKRQQVCAAGNLFRDFTK